MYLIWEAKAVFQGGWFLILIFSHVQPIKYMVIMSDKLMIQGYRSNVTLNKVASSSPGASLPGPAVRYSYVQVVSR